MASMPILPVKLPSCLTGQQNGAISPMLLAPVNGQASVTRVMVANVAKGMEALHRAATSAGFVLGTTGRYRTLQQQWDIFGGRYKRYQPCTLEVYNATPKARRKLWKRKDRTKVIVLLGPQTYPVADSDYWVKIQQPNGKYPASSATPGTSNHGWACADDLAQVVIGKNGKPRTISLTGPCRDWLFANAPRHGFAWQTPVEPWHVHWICGDDLPLPVRDEDAMRLVRLVGDATVWTLAADRVRAVVDPTLICLTGPNLVPSPPTDLFRPAFLAFHANGPLPTGWTAQDFASWTA